MPAERFDELMSLYLDDALTPEQERELVALLDLPEWQRRFLELDTCEGRIAAALCSPIADAEMLKLLRQELFSGKPPNQSNRALRVIDAVHDVAQRVPPPRATQRTWFKRIISVTLVAGFAAGVLFFAFRASPPKNAPAPTASLSLGSGTVSLTRGNSITTLTAAETLVPGDKISTEKDGSALLTLGDGSRLDLRSETTLLLSTQPNQLELLSGRLRAEVKPQAPGNELVFRSPHGDSSVIGTVLKLTVTLDATRLDVKEGRVKFIDRKGGSVVVGAKQYSVATADGIFSAAPLATSDILILPRTGKTSGSHWRLVKDPEAISGEVWEAPDTRENADSIVAFKAGALGHVDFSFEAEGFVQYHMWLRARCMAAGPKYSFHYDKVSIQPLTGKVVRPVTDLPGINAFDFNGYHQWQSYWWVGGDNRDNQTPEGDNVVASVIFDKPGTQTLRLYIVEGPMRVDALLLSRTISTRPKPNDFGPVGTSLRGDDF